MSYIPFQDDRRSHSDLRPEGVLRELFNAATVELRDEVNVPLEHQRQPELLGVVRDLDHGGRCGLEFLIKLKVGSGGNELAILQFLREIFPFLFNLCLLIVHAVALNSNYKWEKYRVTILDGYNLPLPRIRKVLSTYLGSR